MCGEPTTTGAEWRGANGTVAVCHGCLRQGQLVGALIGDSAANPADLVAMLEAVEAHAWRAFTLARNGRGAGVACLTVRRVERGIRRQAA
jgi:hypothetical protein